MRLRRAVEAILEPLSCMVVPLEKHTVFGPKPGFLVRLRRAVETILEPLSFHKDSLWLVPIGLRFACSSFDRDMLLRH